MSFSTPDPAARQHMALARGKESRACKDRHHMNSKKMRVDLGHKRVTYVQSEEEEEIMVACLLFNLTQTTFAVANDSPWTIVKNPTAT